MINFYPRAGMVLMCDFDGFIIPEMQKRRPVIVVSKVQMNNRKLCTIVPLSTTDPWKVEKHHYLLQGDYPFIHPVKNTWAKCDMLYRVSFERLDRMKISRSYQSPRLSKDDLQNVLKAVKSTLYSGA